MGVRELQIAANDVMPVTVMLSVIIVFVCRFGGYGRLGHNGAADELVPREVSSLSSDPPNPQRQVRHIFAGSTYSLAISLSAHTYFFGILPNSPRGEACTYPRVMQELYDYPAVQVGGGSSWVMVNSDNAHVIFWGTPTAGKFGLEGNARSSANPKFVSATDGFEVLSVVCGYGHCCMVVGRGEGQTEDQYRERMQSLPEIVGSSQKGPPAAAGSNKSKRKNNISSSASTKAKRGKK